MCVYVHSDLHESPSSKWERLFVVFCEIFVQVKFTIGELNLQPRHFHLHPKSESSNLPEEILM